MRKRVTLGRRRTVEEPEIIVIPMIDVMMFLLFFFMVASLALAVQAGLPVNLPKASTANTSTAQTVTVTVMADGRSFLNTKPVPIADLQTGLEALKLDANSVITLNIDKTVAYGTALAAMDAIRRAGLTRFTFATDKG